MEKKLTKEQKQIIEYEKFQSKVKRLTPYGHDKRMFSRMEEQKRRNEEDRKANKKGAAVKKETVS